VRGVYALVPFLMALGCAAVTTFLALKSWRLLRTTELSFHRLILKSSGRIQTAGWAFLAFSIFAVGLNAHSGWVRFHEYEVGQAKALSLYYRGTILNRLGLYEQARTNLDAALAEREDLILARQEKGESLWLLGRKEEAITVWTDALRRNERLALVSNQLAGVKRSLGKIEEAIAHEKQADQFTPDDPLYHWMLGLRLKNLGMNELAEKHFQRAIQLDPKFQSVFK